MQNATLKVQNMLDIDQISRLLLDRKLDVVSEKTGLHRNIIASIRDGRTTNPNYLTIKSLSDYLENEPFGEHGGIME